MCTQAYTKCRYPNVRTQINMAHRVATKRAIRLVAALGTIVGLQSRFSRRVKRAASRASVNLDSAKHTQELCARRRGV